VSRRLLPAAVLIAALPGAGSALELGGLSELSERAACVAYVLLDLGARHRAGTLSDPLYRDRTTMLSRSVQGQGGRPNAALERRIDEMIEWISAENPGATEITAKAEVCREVLGL
jgi:hypothetical protein